MCNSSMAVTKIILALFVARVTGLELHGMQFAGVNDAIEYAKELGSKSSPVEQEVMKTLLKDRAQWHPRAEETLNEVAKRPSPPGRRLFGTAFCDGATEETCKAQVDEQCAPCVWKYGNCAQNECGGYDSKDTCCANVNKIASGCVWYAGGCQKNECNSFSTGNTVTADGTKACNDHPGCAMIECDAPKDMPGKKFATCVEGTADQWECKRQGEKGEMGYDQFAPAMKATATAGDLGALMGGLMGALGGMGPNACNVLDCAQCMKSDNCADKQKSALSGGKCADRCTGIAHDVAEVQCLFCGQKAQGCKAKVATPSSSCTAIPLPSTTVTTSPAPTCKATCASASAACPNTAGAAMNCFVNCTTAIATPLGSFMMSAMTGSTSANPYQGPAQCEAQFCTEVKKQVAEANSKMSTYTAEQKAAMAAMGMGGGSTINLPAQCGGASSSQPKRQVVKVSFTFKALDFKKLTAAQTTSVTAAVVDGVLASLPTGYKKEHIKVTLKEGSVIADVEVTPLAGTTASSLTKTLDTNTQTALRASVTSKVSAVAGIDTALAAGKTKASIASDTTGGSPSVGTQAPTSTASSSEGVVLGTLTMLIVALAAA